MDSFKGQWVDRANAVITIQEEKNLISSVTYDNGRGPFQGFEIDLYSPVISVNFTDGDGDSGLQVGVMSLDKKTIMWSNTTVWTRK